MLKSLKNTEGKILNLFFYNPDKKYYFREISKKLNKTIGSIQPYMNTLVKEGILIDERIGNLRFFSINKSFIFYKEIESIVSKTFGIQHHIKKALIKIKALKLAFIFGSIATGLFNTESDVDLMIIGKIDEDLLLSEIDQIETEIGREINYIIYTDKEFIDKIKNKNEFISNVMSGEKIILKGKIDEYRRLYKKGSA